jgi:hypothetical protein
MDPNKWLPIVSLDKSLACVYCGSPADSKDHAPPKCLLPRPFPKGLRAITVPSCKSCNIGFAEDDLKFAAVICTVSFMTQDRLAVAKDGWVYRRMQRNRAYENL